MIDPPRLLDHDTESFGSRLLRSAEPDRPSARATRRAMVSASAAAVAALGATSAAAAPSAAIAKSVVTWLLAGSLGGAILSVSAHEISLRSAERASQAKAAERLRSFSPPPARRPEALPPAALRAPDVASASAIQPAPPELPLARASAGRANEVEVFSIAPRPAASVQGSHDEAAPKALPEPSSFIGSGSAAASANASKGPGFSDEVSLIDRARQRLSAGDSGSSLSLLRRYEAAFPSGHFLPEALALRVEALSAAGQVGNARRAAERFLSGYPAHPLSARVRAIFERFPASATPR